MSASDPSAPVTADSFAALRFAELAEKVQQYRPHEDLKRLRRAE